jgi:hypothetical protein
VYATFAIQTLYNALSVPLCNIYFVVQNGASVLMISLGNKPSEEVVEVLLKYRADPNGVAHCPALVTAFLSGVSTDVIKLLIRKGADVNRKCEVRHLFLSLDIMTFKM